MIKITEPLYKFVVRWDDMMMLLCFLTNYTTLILIISLTITLLLMIPYYKLYSIWTHTAFATHRMVFDNTFQLDRIKGLIDQMDSQVTLSHRRGSERLHLPPWRTPGGSPHPPLGPVTGNPWTGSHLCSAAGLKRHRYERHVFTWKSNVTFPVCSYLWSCRHLDKLCCYW